MAQDVRYLKENFHIIYVDKEDGTFHHAGIQGVFHSGFDRAAFQASLSKHGFHAITFTTAHTVQRDGKEYPVFLVVARR